MTELPSSFLTLVNTMSPNQLKKMKRILSDRVSNTPKASDYVVQLTLAQMSENFMDELWAEAASLNLIKSGSDKVQTLWLSLKPGPYKFGGRTYLAKDLKKYPATKLLMDMVNSSPETTQNMDCVLLSYYPTKSALTFHADDEPHICQNSSICTFMLGETKMFDVIKKSAKVTRKTSSASPDLSLALKEGSLTVMKPGCQQLFKHGVRPGIVPSTTKRTGRFAWSFRHYGSTDEELSDISSDSELLMQHSVTTTPIKPLNLSSSAPSPAFSPAFSPVEPSQSSTPTKHMPPNDPAPPKRVSRVEPITLMAGDSFYRDLSPDKLGKGKKLVKNISKGGSTIKQVEESLKKFASDNPPVTKVFLSIGANDIRYAKCGVQHLKTPVADLLRTTKELFPRAKIWVQSILPIPQQREMMITDVQDMNVLIFRACMRLKVFFLNVSETFIDPNTRLRDTRYFPDPKNVHLGKIGTSVLAKIYIRQIHSRHFNPLGY